MACRSVSFSPSPSTGSYWETAILPTPTRSITRLPAQEGLLASPSAPPLNCQGFCAPAKCRLLCAGLTVRSGKDSTVWPLSLLLHLPRSWGTTGGLDLRLDIWIQTQLCRLAAVRHWTSYLISLGSSFLICQMRVNIEVAEWGSYFTGVVRIK